MIRLDKYLADMQVGTRSEVKKIVSKGRVLVNNQICKDSSAKLDPAQDIICVDGQPLVYEQFHYYMLHKPAGCVTARSDQRHKTVMDYMKAAAGKNLSPVGRLDLDTEGLLLVTDDGEFLHRLLAPSKHVPKTYYAFLQGTVSKDDVNHFKTGVNMGENGLCKSAKLELLQSFPAGTVSKEELTQILKQSASEFFFPETPLSETETYTKVMITIEEGKFHQIKRMCQAIGCEVVYLKRMTMGDFQLDESLNAGTYRTFTLPELKLVQAYKNEKESS